MIIDTYTSLFFKYISNDLVCLMLYFVVAVYVSQAASDGQDILTNVIDDTITPQSKGLTIEMCAGLVDKKLSLVQIAKEEVQEECGYDAPLENFEVIVSSR